MSQLAVDVFIGQIYIFQVSTLVLLVREIIVAIVVVDGDY